jgi:hypothetical protein
VQVPSQTSIPLTPRPKPPPRHWHVPQRAGIGQPARPLAAGWGTCARDGLLVNSSVRASDDLGIGLAWVLAGSRVRVRCAACDRLGQPTGAGGPSRRPRSCEPGPGSCLRCKPAHGSRPDLSRPQSLQRARTGPETQTGPLRAHRAQPGTAGHAGPLRAQPGRAGQCQGPAAGDPGVVTWAGSLGVAGRGALISTGVAGRGALVSDPERPCQPCAPPPGRSSLRRYLCVRRLGKRVGWVREAVPSACDRPCRLLGLCLTRTLKWAHMSYGLIRIKPSGNQTPVKV